MPTTTLRLLLTSALLATLPAVQAAMDRNADTGSTGSAWWHGYGFISLTDVNDFAAQRGAGERGRWTSCAAPCTARTTSMRW